MYSKIKIVADMIFAFLGIVIFLPLLILTVFWIKIVSKGPVLYGQERVGLKGKIFHLYKFRTMHTDFSKKNTFSVLEAVQKKTA